MILCDLCDDAADPQPLPLCNTCRLKLTGERTLLVMYIGHVIATTYPCTCALAYTERGLHEPDARHVVCQDAADLMLRSMLG